MKQGRLRKEIRMPQMHDGDEQRERFAQTFVIDQVNIVACQGGPHLAERRKKQMWVFRT
jgi:hypothetical protein